MPLLFSYGTLQQSNVQPATFDGLLHGQQDELTGFKLSLVRIEDPQVVATSGKTHHANVTRTGNGTSRVSGTVFEITAADDYETSGRYVRLNATLVSGKKTWMYIHTSSAGAL